MYRTYVQSVLTHGTESCIFWRERSIWWMCGVPLKDRKQSDVLYSLLGIQSVTEVVRHGRLRWFGHLERKSGVDWMLACRNVEVVGEKCRGRETWREFLNDDMKLLGLLPEWAVFRDMSRGLHIKNKRLTLAERGRNRHFENKWWWWGMSALMKSLKAYKGKLSWIQYIARESSKLLTIAYAIQTSLKPEIRQFVARHQPKSLKVIDSAILAEKNWLRIRCCNGRFHSNNTPKIRTGRQTSGFKR